MPKLSEIIEELNLENGSKYKIGVLKQYKNREDLKKLLKMTYDKVSFKYFITMKNIPEVVNNTGDLTLLEALDKLLHLHDKVYSGNAAIDYIHSTLESLTKEDSDIFAKVINRQLRISLGSTHINSVFKNLLSKSEVAYMRCDVFTKDKKNEETGKIKKGTIKNIDFKDGAILDLKADGTYREFNVKDKEVISNSRSGETYDYPVLNEFFCQFPDNVYMGELTVVLDKELLKKLLPKFRMLDKKNGTTLEKDIVEEFNNTKENEKMILPRALGNGLINSDDIPHENIICELWDCVSHEEYNNALNKIKNSTTYENRVNNLKEILKIFPSDKIYAIESYEVFSIKEALQITSNWMNKGLEGGVLKNKKALFKHGTSSEQLKLKVEFPIEVRITGFTEGTAGTKREATFGAITYTTDDGMIQGQTSGFTDDMLEDFNSRREELIGSIMTISGNDLTKGRNNDYYAISHPRFVELRDDKDYTDTLASAQKSLNMAKNVQDSIDELHSPESNLDRD